MNNWFLITNLFLIVTFIFVAWILIHLLAFFGIFLAIAFPIYWLFAPEQTPCLLCRANNEGKICLFCQREINKSESISPVSLLSAVFNGFLILLFSITSVGIVYLESQVLFKLGFSMTPKTVSFVIPTKHQYRLNEVFPMKIEIVGIKTPINTVQADLGFEGSKLEIVNISTEDSFANIFIQKEINNEGGYCRLTGGLPSPGFFSDHGTFGTVFFKGKVPGIAKVEYLPSSMVLANDGNGTNVLKELPSVSYLILPEKISEEEEKMQQKTITMKSSVLGESTGNTQLKFYNEGEVLGLSKVEEEVKKEEKFSLIKTIFTSLGKIDSFILEQWGKVINLLNIFAN
ncbi:MAG: hypothetical protein ABH812_01045 [bacterium]